MISQLKEGEMGKNYAKQSNLLFENKRLTRNAETGAEHDTEAISSDAQDRQDDDLRSILQDVKISLKVIDNKLNKLTGQLDQVRKRVDTHVTRKWKTECLMHMIIKQNRRNTYYTWRRF